MAKSKRHLKRRKKVKGKNCNYASSTETFEFTKLYMKSDGNCEVHWYDKNHNYIRKATEEEAANF